MKPILKITDLSIAFPREKEQNLVVHNISFALEKNKILGLVGESGSGKSVTSLAIMGLLPKQKAKITGEIFLKDENISGLTEKEFHSIRGNKIAMIFQEPMSSLNPSLTCGYQVLEILLEHTNYNRENAKKEVISLFKKVKLPRAEQIFKQYPHQISGGQKQRVMIAMAIACKPDILIADEPTTALDVTVQKEIILLLKELQQEKQMSILFITHDLALISEIADDIIVMYQGNIVEKGPVKTIFLHPKNAYTKALILSKPLLDRRLKKLPTITDLMQLENPSGFTEKKISKKERVYRLEKMYTKKPILKIVNLATYFTSKNNTVKAVDAINLQIYKGETLGLVGESGCGKTTLGRTIMGLEKATKGSIFYQNKDISKLTKKERRKLAKDIQIIFQDPYSSLNPRMLVGEAILEPMEVHKLYKNKKERKEKVFELLEKVGLQKEHYYRYPHEFSGGQRQRIGIARTIALLPKIIICDESVSALDVSVQAQVLNLLNDLKKDFGFTYIFISHNLAVVKHMADQLAVMNKGKLEEIEDADEIYKNPKKNYTKTLINAIPKGLNETTV